MKVAVVDKCLSHLWYSWYLSRALSRRLPPGSLEFYAPKRDPWKINPGTTNVKPTWSPLLFPLEIFREVVKSQIDVVHIQFELNTFGPLLTSLLAPLLFLLLRLTRAKVVVTIHSAIPWHMVSSGIVGDIAPSGRARAFVVMLPRLVFAVMLAINRSIGALSHAVIVHNRTIEGWLTADYGVDPDKIHIIPHGVDDTLPTMSGERVELWSSRIGPRDLLLFFGVLSPRKGIEDLLRAYAHLLPRHPDSLLVIAGLEPPYYGGYSKSLEALATELGVSDHVLFTGFLSSEDVHALFSIASIVVLPYTYSIASSGPLSYAIQHSKPVIATRTEILDEELFNGRLASLAPVGDRAALAASIEELLDNDGLRDKLSRELGSQVRVRSWKRVAEMTIELYREVSGR
ncbi:MAG: glycosyltransferase family 4 protein [Candidatus Bathyarchaeia archaeon]